MPRTTLGLAAALVAAAAPFLVSAPAGADHTLSVTASDDDVAKHVLDVAPSFVVGAAQVLSRKPPPPAPLPATGVGAGAAGVLLLGLAVGLRRALRAR